VSGFLDGRTFSEKLITYQGILAQQRLRAQAADERVRNQYKICECGTCASCVELESFLADPESNKEWERRWRAIAGGRMWRCRKRDIRGLLQSSWQDFADFYEVYLKGFQTPRTPPQFYPNQWN
jgi:hypothetical protein